MPDQRPSVGQTVHYVSHGTPIRPDGTQAFAAQCRTAFVTEVDPDDPTRVGLMAANPTGLFFHPLASGGCLLSETVHPDGSYDGGTWHWPERV